MTCTQGKHVRSGFPVAFGVSDCGVFSCDYGVFKCECGVFSRAPINLFFKGCQHWQGGLILFKVPSDMLQIVNFCRMSISLVYILCFCASAPKRARHWRAGLTWADLTWHATELYEKVRAFFCWKQLGDWKETSTETWHRFESEFVAFITGRYFFLFKIACALTPGCHLGVQADLTWPVGSKMGSIHSPQKKLLPKWLTEILPSPIFNVNQLVAYTRFYQLGQWLSLAQDPALWMQLNDDFVKFCSTTSSWCFGLTLPAPQRELAAFGHAGAKSKPKSMSTNKTYQIEACVVFGHGIIFSITACFRKCMIMRRVPENVVRISVAFHCDQNLDFFCGGACFTHYRSSRASQSIWKMSTKKEKYYHYHD